MSIKVLVISNYNEMVVSRPEGELFIKLKNRGLDVSIMTNGKSEYAARFRENGIRVIDFYPDKKYSLKAIKLIRKELKNGHYNIVHLFSSRAISNGIRAAFGLPVKVVLYRGYTGNIHWWSPKSYLKYLNPRVDRIMCIAQATQELIQRNLFRNKDKVIWIRKGHMPEWYSDITPANLAEFGVKPQDTVFINVSNFRTMKGIIYLVKALDLLPDGLNFKLLLVGRNMNDKRIEKKINQSKYKHQIILTGFRKDALNLVKSSDVFVLPSIKGEAINTEVIEAMRLGVARIITDIPGNRNLVINKKNGLVVPKKNPEVIARAMLTMIEDEQLRKEYGQKAREYMHSDFHHDRTVDAVFKMYSELAG